MDIRTLIIISTAASAFAACGNDEQPSETPATAPSPAFGVYTREVTEADLERTAENRHDAPGFEPAPTGRWQLTLAPGQGVDVVKVTDPEGLTIEMDGKVDGDQLRLVAYSAPERGAFCDQAIPVLARYSLEVEGGALSLAPSEEQCADRDSVLTGTWKKG